MVIPRSHVHRHEDCLACCSHRPGFLYMPVKLYFCVRFDHHGVSMGLYIGHSGSKKKFVDSLVGQLRSVYLECLLTSLDSISCFTFYQHQLVSIFILICPCSLLVYCIDGLTAYLMLCGYRSSHTSEQECRDLGYQRIGKELINNG